jgi:addiction module HigA family antidote
MADNNDSIHPGEILAEEFLKPHGLSANRLALAIGVPANRITAIVKGERGVTGEAAILLGHTFRTSPEFWLNLQAHYELELAKGSVSADRISRADKLAAELCRPDR